MKLYLDGRLFKGTEREFFKENNFSWKIWVVNGECYNEEWRINGEEFELYEFFPLACYWRCHKG